MRTILWPHVRLTYTAQTTSWKLKADNWLFPAAIIVHCTGGDEMRRLRERESEKWFHHVFSFWFFPFFFVPPTSYLDWVWNTLLLRTWVSLMETIVFQTVCVLAFLLNEIFLGEVVRSRLQWACVDLWLPAQLTKGIWRKYLVYLEGF